jgi:hypothetical protein
MAGFVDSLDSSPKLETKVEKSNARHMLTRLSLYIMYMYM